MWLFIAYSRHTIYHNYLQKNPLLIKEYNMNNKLWLESLSSLTLTMSVSRSIKKKRKILWANIEFRYKHTYRRKWRRSGMRWRFKNPWKEEDKSFNRKVSQRRKILMVMKMIFPASMRYLRSIMTCHYSILVGFWFTSDI